jgi:hypothetical protein
MGSVRKVQGKVWISDLIWDKFHMIVARKWGIHKHGLLSYELEQALKYYISVAGILPEKAHTHKNLAENTIPTFQPRKKVNDKVELLATAGSRTEERRRPQAETMEESPILRNWLMTKGIDIADINRFNQSVTDADLQNAHKLRSDFEYHKQWRKDCIAKLEAKDNRISHNNMLAKLDKQDREEIAPVMKVMKQFLWHTYGDVIMQHDRIDREPIYEAFKVATGHSDRRTFSDALVLYVLHEYLKPLNKKKTSFRLMDKFKEL